MGGNFILLVLQTLKLIITWDLSCRLRLCRSLDEGLYKISLMWDKLWDRKVKPRYFLATVCGFKGPFCSDTVV